VLPRNPGNQVRSHQVGQQHHNPQPQNLNERGVISLDQERNYGRERVFGEQL
jgi:hypothetical protein